MQISHNALEIFCAIAFNGIIVELIQLARQKDGAEWVSCLTLAVGLVCVTNAVVWLCMVRLSSGSGVGGLLKEALQEM